MLGNDATQHLKRHREACFLMYCARFALLYGIAVKIGCTLAIKINMIYFVLRSVYVTLRHCREDRLHLGNKNKYDLFCIALGLRYFTA